MQIIEISDLGCLLSHDHESRPIVVSPYAAVQLRDTSKSANRDLALRHQHVVLQRGTNKRVSLRTAGWCFLDSGLSGAQHSSSSVWPWLVQIGQTRGGFYSYTWLENAVGCHMRTLFRQPQQEIMKILRFA